MARSTNLSSGAQTPSLFEGPSSPPLLELTLGELLDIQALRHGQRECLVIPWTGARWTYHDLSCQSALLAAGLVDAGVRQGDRVAIMAGNCEQYATVFFAVAKIGAILVILNSAYSAREAMHGLRFTDSKVLFTTTKIGKSDNTALLYELEARGKQNPLVVILRGGSDGYTTYDELFTGRSDESLSAARKASSRVHPRDVVNLQFTSGTTGLPKAAMLTHQ
jgi:acyl-CoA synthetase (AMP-forming)/AMP-acid ligase II